MLRVTPRRARRVHQLPPFPIHLVLCTGRSRRKQNPTYSLVTKRCLTYSDNTHNVITIPNDNILDPVCDVNVSVFVQSSQITGHQPSVFSKDLCRN